MSTLATLIINLETNHANLMRGVEQVEGKLNKLESTVGKAGKMLAGAFTVTAIVAAGKKVLDFADTMTNLSQKTGISTTGLQKLELAFMQSGISVETVAKASSDLANRLIGGDKGVVSALTKMGLSVADLKRMAPEQQFLTVADAVGKIQNPTEKTYAAMQVFGKGGQQLLAGLTGSLTETIAEFERMGVIIDEQTLKAADDFGDQLGVLSRLGMAFIANVLGPALPGLANLAQWLMHAATAAIQLAQGLQGALIKGLMQAVIWWNQFVLAIAETSQKIPLLGKYIGASAETINGLRDSVQFAKDRLMLFSQEVVTTAKATTATIPPLLGLGDATERTADATKKLAKAQEAAADRKYLNFLGELQMQAEATASAQEGFLATLQKLPAAFDAIPEPTAMFFDQGKMRVASMAGAQAAQDGFLSVMRETGRQVPTLVIPPPGHSAWSQAFAGLGETVRTKLGPTILAALTGGGDVLKSVGGLIGGSLSQHIFGSEGMQKSIAGTFGKTLGGVFNSMLPGIGALAGPLISGIGKLFGKSEGRKQLDVANADIEKLQDNLLKTYGSLENIVAVGGAAGEALAAAWGSQNRDGLQWFKKLLDEFNGSMKETERATEEMARKGRGSFGELTDDLDRLQAQIGNTESLNRLSLAFRDLQHGGKTGIAEIIRETQSLERSLGSTHPSIVTMRDLITTAAATGQWDFAQMAAAIAAMKAEMASPVIIPVIMDFGDVAKARTSEREQAAAMSDAQARASIEDFLSRNDRDRHRISEALGFDPGRVAGLGFKHGTGGRFLNFGAGTEIVAHGRERIVTEDEGRAEAASMAGVEARLDRMMRDLPRAMSIAVQDGLVLAR